MLKHFMHEASLCLFVDNLSRTPDRYRTTRYVVKLKLIFTLPVTLTIIKLTLISGFKVNAKKKLTGMHVAVILYP